MKNESYAIFREEKGSIYQTLFKTKDEAIQNAKWEWEKHLTKEEKRKCGYFAVVEGELDETGYIDLAGWEEIIVFKAWENQ